MNDELNSKLNPVIEQATALQVKGSEGYCRAGDLLKAIKQLKAEVDETFKDAIKAANTAHKKVLSAMQRHAQPLDLCEDRLKKAMISFHGAAAARARAESAKAQAQVKEERDELALEEAANLEKAGREDEAKAVLDRATLTGAPAPLSGEEAPKIPGISIRRPWKHRITDESLIPRQYLKLDATKIGKVVKALGTEADIPGVEVFRGYEIAVTVEGE